MRSSNVKRVINQKGQIQSVTLPNVFTGTGNGIFLTTNSGANWSPSGLAHKIVDAFTLYGSNIFAGADSSVYLSTDNGSTWNAVNTGLESSWILSLAISGNYLFASTTDGVWKRPLSEMVPEELSPASFQFDTILIGGCRTDTLIFTNITNAPDTLQGIDISGQYAKDYSVKNITLETLQPGESENIIMTFCPSVADAENAVAGLIIGTGDTVYIPMYGTGKLSLSVAELVPELSVIIQNYPDPFSIITTINFALPVSCKARIDVYNAIGEHVQTLTDAFMNAGQYAVNFDATQRPQGVYFYTLRAGEYSAMRSMTLIK